MVMNKRVVNTTYTIPRTLRNGSSIPDKTSHLPLITVTAGYLAIAQEPGSISLCRVKKSPTRCECYWRVSDSVTVWTVLNVVFSGVAPARRCLKLDCMVLVF